MKSGFELFIWALRAQTVTALQIPRQFNPKIFMVPLEAW